MDKKVYIKTYGCQMNVYDSLRMKDVLAPHGYSETESVEDADLVILNTCHIREKASEKVYSELGRIRERKDELARNGKQMMIGVAGCVAQAEGAEMMRRAPYIDMVFGPQSYHHLPEMLTKAARAAGGVVELDFPEVQKFDFLPDATHSDGASAFVSVQEGCDKFCTFCVVPYTRGAEYSRPVEAVEREVRQHVGRGVVEITLLGQNVNAYHGEDGLGEVWSLGRLIRHLARIDGLERIRYTTSHPRDMDDALIAAHGDVAKLMPYLHLPIQSGSDKILKAMNRKHKASDYLAIIEKLRAARPDLALSSDFIVGFPGESEADFQATLRLVESVHYAQAYSFKYSPRPGTPAALIDDQLNEEVKAERLARLQDVLNAQQTAFNRSTIGRTLPVLIEKPGKYSGQTIGKSPYLQSVIVEHAEHLIGQLVDVHISQGHANSLRGELIQPDNYQTPPLITQTGSLHVQGKASA